MQAPKKDIIPAIKTQLKCPSRALGPRSDAFSAPPPPKPAQQPSCSDFKLVAAPKGQRALSEMLVEICQMANQAVGCLTAAGSSSVGGGGGVCGGRRWVGQLA